MTTRCSRLPGQAGPVRRTVGAAALWLAAAGAALVAPAARAADTGPAELLAAYAAAGGAVADAARGRAFFLARHGQEWSCASCHGERPVQPGRHAGTGKPIEPLAPAAHPARFTERAKVEKWFRRNCRDVLARECSAQEKADVIAWLIERGGPR